LITLKEKRSKQRIDVELQVFYGRDQKTLLKGFSADFSEGGLFLKTTSPFSVDECLTVEFSIPGQTETSIYCKARVAWINNVDQPCKPSFPPGVGVNFIDISPEDLASVSSFVDIKQAGK